MKETQIVNESNRMKLAHNDGEKITETRKNSSNIELADVEFEKLYCAMDRLEKTINKFEGKLTDVGDSAENAKYIEPSLVEFLYKLQFRVSNIREFIDLQTSRLESLLYTKS